MVVNTQASHRRILGARLSSRAGLFLCLITSLIITSTQCLTTTYATKTAVVVGGGPVGLATALTLSNEPHCYNVTVLEKASVEQYDPTKAYMYNVNPRGQVWMKENFPGAHRKLQLLGSQGSKSRITIVPADPDEPIPAVKTLTLYNFNTTDPVIAEEDKTQGTSSLADLNDDTISYWIPRHSMICLLEDEIQEQEAARKNSSENQTVQGNIVLRKARKFDSLEPLEDGTLQVAVTDVETGTKETYCGSLVVAADGYNSAVRDCLADDTKSTWLQKRPKAFRVKKWMSAASGLRMKVIQMPPGFAIPDSDGSLKPTESEFIYAIRSINNGFRNYISLGLLPVKDAFMIRPANVITRPNHQVWSLTDGPSSKEWFTKAFPRFHWDDYVNDAEWDRFAQAEGTSFPNCQYSPALQATSPDQNSGVVLVGDSAHAFPPDVGQGINAGLCDVVALDRALRGKDPLTGMDKEKPATLGAALQEYERVQGPEIRALIRLSRFGNPYQYRQALFRDRIGRLLSTFNIAFRLLLNKLSFGLVPPSCIVLVQNPKLTYRQVMRRADMTTAGLSAAVVAVGWKLLGASIKRAVGLA